MFYLLCPFLFFGMGLLPIKLFIIVPSHILPSLDAEHFSILFFEVTVRLGENLYSQGQ